MLGLKFSRLVHASLAGGSLMLAGCVDRAYDFGDSGDDSFTPDPDPDPDPDPNPTGPQPPPPPPPPPPDVPGPPQLITARFGDTNTTLALTFSEALAPPTSINPRQFRLTTAFAPPEDYGYSYGTFYQEAGLWNGEGYFCDEYCYEYCYQDQCYEECFEYCYTPPGPPVQVTAITPMVDRPDVWLLTINPGIGSGVCNQLEGAPPEWVSDLFITYTPQGTAPVTDNAGESLAPIAEHWALSPDEEYAYIEGFFEQLQPMLPIPCPF